MVPSSSLSVMNCTSVPTATSNSVTTPSCAGTGWGLQCAPTCNSGYSVASNYVCQSQSSAWTGGSCIRTLECGGGMKGGGWVGDQAFPLLNSFPNTSTSLHQLLQSPTATPCRVPSAMASPRLVARARCSTASVRPRVSLDIAPHPITYACPRARGAPTPRALVS